MTLFTFIYLTFVSIAIPAIIIMLINEQTKLNPGTLLPSILKNIKELIFVVNPDMLILLTNPGAEKLLKYKNNELIGKKLDQFLENTTPIFSSTAKDQNWTSYCLDADKNKIPVVVSLKKINRDNIGYVYVIKDISDRQNKLKIIEEKTREIEQKNLKIDKLEHEIELDKQSMEEKVKQRSHDFEEEHARLLASINNLSLGFLMTDKYKNILLYNESAYYILPSLYTKSKTINELEQAEKINYPLKDKIDKAMSENKVIRITDMQTATKFVNIYISPITLEKGALSECLGAVIIIEDKTEQYKLEESKEDLFSIASHELRTPLTAIYGYTSLIKQIYYNELKNEDLKVLINKIGVLSKKLSTNINNFLDSQRLEWGNIELKKEPCDLYTTINTAIKETEKLAQDKNLYIKFDFPSQPVTVIGDQKRIIQIIEILINNAEKFTNMGGISISIELLSNLVKIIIQDTGSGIPKENSVLLFNKFQQAEDNLLTRQEGTGLGLHIAKLLVEKMGGTIKLEKTEVNKGSTFSFTIPLLN